VTVTAVGAGCLINSTAIGGCSITATFTLPHTVADPISSGMYGLQEALNDASASGGGTVTVDSAWAGLGGTSGMVSAATIPSNTGIEDERTGPGSTGGSGTVGAGTTGQAAVYTGNGTTVAGGTLGIGGGGTGATTAAGALTNLGAQINLGATQTGAIGASGTATFPGNVAAGASILSPDTVLSNTATAGSPATTVQIATAPVWNRLGGVLHTGEPTFLWETGAQILSTSNPLMKVWGDCQSVGSGMCYKESLDGKTNWTTEVEIIPGYWRSWVMHDGSTYYMFGILMSTNQQVDVWTSTNGYTGWTLLASNILSLGTGTAWNSKYFGNISVIHDTDGLWKLLQEAESTVSNSMWTTGAATSSSPAGPWTWYANNPVLGVPGSLGVTGALMFGGSDIWKDPATGIYWVWGQTGSTGPTTGPTQIVRYSSPDFYNWTQNPKWPTLPQLTALEGFGNPCFTYSGNYGQFGQIADPSLVQVNGQTYLYYAAQPGQSSCPGYASITMLAIYDGTLHQLVGTDEGAFVGRGGMVYPPAPGSPKVIPSTDGFQWLPSFSLSGSGSAVLLSNGPVINNSTNSSAGATLVIDDVSGGNASNISFESQGVALWGMGKQTDNSFYIGDGANSGYPLAVSTSGGLILGETGKTTTVVDTFILTQNALSLGDYTYTGPNTGGTLLVGFTGQTAALSSSAISAGTCTLLTASISSTTGLAANTMVPIATSANQTQLTYGLNIHQPYISTGGTSGVVTVPICNDTAAAITPNTTPKFNVVVLRTTN
jgi:hypothetical protein